MTVMKGVSCMKEMDVEQLLSDLHKATGMAVQLSDAQFRSLLCFNSSREYCALLHNEAGALEACMRSDLFGFHRVRATGEPYSYICPFGLSTAIFPVREGNAIVGYLYIGGLVRSEKGSEGLLQCVREQLGTRAATAQLLQRIEELPRTDETRFEALCGMARVCCEYIEQNALFPVQENSIGALAERFILQNLHTKITLARICLELHCSKATLTESFRREHGVTVVQFLNEQRLLRAKELLLHTQRPVHLIAQDCGFSGVEYFSAQFKKRYGCSPIAARKQGAEKF